LVCARTERKETGGEVSAMSSEWPAISSTQHLVNNLAIFILLGLFDHLLLKPWLVTRGVAAGRDLSNGRWFFLHAFANFWVTIAAAHSVVAVLLDPLHAMDSSVHVDRSFFGSASVWPLTIINSVHVYHMAGGFNLSSADYFHHLLFIPLLGFPGQVLPWGAIESCGAFFISGLPGGVDYFLLGLCKVGLCTSAAEKRYSANLNTWLRTPGILLTSCFVYQGMVYGKHQLPIWAILTHVFLPPFNALYYGKQAVANYAIHYITKLLAQDDLVKTRMDHMRTTKVRVPLPGSIEMAWQQAIAVPQRGS